MWLLRNHRLIWQVLEEEQVVDLIYVGPKPPDLYEQLGLGKRLREAEDALVYEVELDRSETINTETIQDSARTSATTLQEKS